MTDEIGIFVRSWRRPADLLREMIDFAALRLMEMEVAGYSEKNSERLAQRNGYRIGTGRHAPARSSCAFPSRAREAISQAS